MSPGDTGFLGPSFVPVPQPTGGTIVDQDAAIRLGKALFWDMQAGSDGKIACASCHFQAGTDGRTHLSMHPGPDHAWGGGNDVVGSSGVLSMSFTGISTDLNDAVDICAPVTPGDDSQALIASSGHRLVTGRQAPPAVGAVFYLDNFWDGRASHQFNGQNPLGTGVPIAGIASLASQAVGPPGSDVEMACAGRKFNGPNSLGAKLVPRTPLALQFVDPTDSVLGPLSNAPGNGLECGFADRPCTYGDLIAAAFGTGGLSGQAAADAYVADFASIWGQAVAAYEATLIPDRTPYDRGVLTPAQVSGLDEFRQRCAGCHTEPEFTDASVRIITENGGTGVPDATGSDQGFHNIGASASSDDPGRKGSPGGTYHTAASGALDFNNGAFKTPALRNVKLTAPYMHNGKLPTLASVLDFYKGVGQIQNPEIDPEATAGVSGGSFDDVLDFLANGLTDCRVEHDLAPFDHPSLVLPYGNLDGSDRTLPARGAAGDGTACP